MSITGRNESFIIYCQRVDVCFLLLFFSFFLSFFLFSVSKSRKKKHRARKPDENGYSSVSFTVMRTVWWLLGLLLQQSHEIPS
mmetsp:Transcript_16883/g.29854  ORF Transcript_16883/g.29854 Transcript_16883/m.29854 type:complete len:83 (+) Transcript_16883:71-319(+)